MKSKTGKNIFHSRIPDGKSIQQRIETISEKTGKKMYAVAREIMMFGLPHVEREAGINQEKP